MPAAVSIFDIFRVLVLEELLSNGPLSTLCHGTLASYPRERYRHVINYVHVRILHLLMERVFVFILSNLITCIATGYHC